MTVTLTTPGGTATLPNGFTYSDPVTPIWATALEPYPDPAVVPNASLRAAILATGRPWRVVHAGTSIEMMLIPPGSFLMGCTASSQHTCSLDGAEVPNHTVTLTGAFYLGRFEVTQDQWTAVMFSNPSQFQDGVDAGLRPVDGLTWAMIQGFLGNTGMRLPTEAEWEYACRAGTTTAYQGFTGYPAGTSNEALVDQFAWYVGNNGEFGSPSYGTKPVGQKLPNGFGLHDMHGNIHEAVSDWWLTNYYSTSPSVDPQGPATGIYRVSRGSSFNGDAGDLRASARWYVNTSFGATSGVRVAKNP
jgi:formylglycine-generating enzyme required for sulfatase activity